MIMIDTDVLIWILRGKEQFYEQFREIAVSTSGDLFVTPIQVAEIFAGTRDPGKDRTEAFISALKLFQPGLREGMHAGHYLKRYKKSHGVTIADALIASSVRCEGMRLWTLNIKHYPMLDKKHIFAFHG